MDRILISGLRASGVHGVLPEEHLHPQPFEVDLELDVDLSVAGGSDDLADTVNYAEIVDGTRAVIEAEHHQLLERMATRIAEVCRVDPRVQAVRVTVRKLQPPVDAVVAHVGVSIRR